MTREAYKRVVDQDSIQWETHRAKDEVDFLAARIVRCLADTEKADRLKRRECRRCFYLRSPKIGGAAMTLWACGICSKEQMHSSTAVPRVCLDCAKDHEVCAECGGDVLERVRRKYP
jgi:hypothetical protein